MPSSVPPPPSARPAGRRPVLAALTAAATGAALLLAPAIAAGSPAADPLAGTGPKDCVPYIGTNQIVLPLPGLFLPLPDLRGEVAFTDLPPAAEGADLPARVDFRDGREGFNPRTEFALDDGRIHARPRGSDEPWRVVPTPDCLDGEVTGISVDANMLVALDEEGWLYSLDNLLSDPDLWVWTRAFGAPIWLWPGVRTPGDPAAGNTWSLSHRMTESFTDADGHTHPTTAGLVQMVSLAGDGSRIVYLDPWLPADHSYEIGGPLYGRFIAESISTSASVTMVMNSYGDIHTRKYDLDLAGANHIPGRYTWQDQDPAAPEAPNQLFERFDPQYAAISLPAEPWRRQPKIPGEITDRISVLDAGPAMEDRTLVVEGRDGGRTGYWAKPLETGDWEFTATDRELRGRALAEADPTRDQSALTLAPATGMDYAGDLPGDWSGRIDDFDWAQTTHPVTLVSPSGTEHSAVLHTTDALRLIPRGDGLDADPRTLEGALDLRGVDDPELGVLAAELAGGTAVTEVTIQATDSALTLTGADLGALIGPPLTTLHRVD